MCRKLIMNCLQIHQLEKQGHGQFVYVYWELRWRDVSNTSIKRVHTLQTKNFKTQKNKHSQE